MLKTKVEKRRLIVLFIVFLLPVAFSLNRFIKHRRDNALIRACWDGNASEAKSALSHGADINAVGRDEEIADAKGKKPFEIAVTRGWTDIVGLLIDAGAKPTLETFYNSVGNIKCALLLLDRFPDFDLSAPPPPNKEPTLLNPIVEKAVDACSNDISERTGEGVRLIRTLVIHKADVNARGWNNETALITAAEKGSLPIVEELLAQHAAIDAQSDSGWTPLSSAARIGYPEVVKLLLARGASIKVGVPVLHSMAIYPQGTRQKEAAELLKSAGVK